MWRRGNPETSPFITNKNVCMNLEVKYHKRMSAMSAVIAKMALQLSIRLGLDIYEPCAPKFNVFVDYRMNYNCD